MPRRRSVETTLSMHDFSRGLLSGISERGVARPNWLAGADNLYGRPYRALRVRPGSRDISTATLLNPPHSLMGFYSGGGNKLFVAAANEIREATAAAYTLQTLPASHPASSDIFTHTNLDGVLIATQRGGALTPLMYDGGWKELKLPKPASAPTVAVAGGGFVDTGNHYYRIRWRFAKGSSLAGPVSTVAATTAGNNTVNLTAIPTSARSDYIGFTVERTKVNGTNAGPWWFVADVDGAGTTYSDTKSDAQLGYMADEGLHGEPQHFDGLAGFAGLLWGWVGSKLYASRDIGDLEATGIANFDADDLFQISKDDGDTIQVCVVVLDELLILKKRSVHVITGVDRESFVLTSVVYADPARGSEAGCAGPRAACVIGGRAYFWGESGGLFTYSRGSVSPVAWSEVGRYLDELNSAALDKLLLINHQGNYLLAWYSRASSAYASDQVVYDARFKQWWHWKGWVARDAIELKGGLFGNASLVIADDQTRGSLPAIASGSTVEDDYVLMGGGLVPATGAIPIGATVVGDVMAGAFSFTMSANALQTVQGATFIIGGVRIEDLNTTAGSATVTAGGFHCWALMEGFLDQRESSGQGGRVVPIAFETPWMDGGLPDEWKDLDRVALSAEGSPAAVSLSIATDPPGGDTTVSLISGGQGNSWAADSGDDPDDLIWDVGEWATDAPATSPNGVPAGTLGRRFKFTAAAEVGADYRPSGFEAIAVLLPDKEYDR